MSTLYIPAGSITNAEIASSAAIGAGKVVQEFARDSRQANGADVASKTELIHTARAAGTIGALKVALTTAPTGGNKKFTVDLQKSTGGGAFATVLSAVVDIDNTDTSLTVVSGTLAASAYVSGDIFAIVWTASGTTGNQGQGAIAEVFFEESTA
jgi:hypothetical protein